MTGPEWTSWQFSDDRELHASRAELQDAERRVEFELRRAANRGDTRVARASGTNAALVRRVRERLGAYPTAPV